MVLINGRTLTEPVAALLHASGPSIAIGPDADTLVSGTAGATENGLLVW